MLNNQKPECNFKLNFPTFFSSRSSTTGRLFNIPKVSAKVNLLKYMIYSFPIPILVAVIERMLLSVHSIPQALQYSNEVKVPIASTVTLSKHINLLVPISSIKFKTTTHQVVQIWVQWTINIRVKWFRFGKRSPYEDAQRMLASMDQSFNGQVRPRWPFGTCSLFIYTVNLLVRETQKSERPKYAFGELSFFADYLTLALKVDFLSHF